MRKPAMFLAVGILIFLISLAADAIGVGEGSGIGWKQITGSVVGLIIAAIGAFQMRKKTQTE